MFRTACSSACLIALWLALPLAGAGPADADPRNIRTGLRIPDQGYCDQPYVVITKNGHWLCVLTTGAGKEGQRGQHVVSTISKDQGKTWSPLVDIEPAGGPEASWAVPLVTPSGRVYVFYDYNGDGIHSLNGKRIRADMLGWYVFKYSDDHGQTWSKERQRLPLRLTACDRTNDWQGKVQIFWGICKPQVAERDVVFTFSKLGRYMLDQGEGWLYHSDNILTEPDVAKIHWDLWPEGDHGIRAPELGSVQEEHNVVSFGAGRWYCVYRTTTGYPCQSYSMDNGKTWSKPEFMTHTLGGQRLKNPRACPKLWRTANGKYLFWFHNHSGKSFQDRNPAWIVGGVERGGRLHWSQPEILLYDPDPQTRMSYPDLIEQDGRYWVTETQKTVARVHEIDRSLLEGLWTQGEMKTISQRGCILDLDTKQVRTPEVKPAQRLDPSRTGGLALDLWLTLSDLEPGQTILDTRDAAGHGLALTTTKAGTLRIELNDGTTRAAWDSDAGRIRPNQLHHIVISADAGPRIITFVIDGVLCDGGTQRQYGWGRWSGPLGDVSGNGKLRLASALHGEIKGVRIFDRFLRTSEAVAHFRAGSSS